MSQTDKTRKKTLDAIKADLFSGDDSKVMAALKKMEEQGDSSLVAPLIEAFFSTHQQELRSKMAGMLSELKVSGAHQAFADALNNERFAPIHSELMAFMWNSGINAPQHLPTIVRVSLKGEFMQTFEGITLIESMEGPFSEEQITESMVILRQYLGDKPDPERKALVEELYRLIVELENQV